MSEGKHKIDLTEQAISEDVVTDLQSLLDRDAKFGTIYADPPWQYDNHGTRGAARDHYGTMSLDDICALPIEQLAADDAHLHIWTTSAFLFDTERVIKSWGFEYKSSFVWVKPQIGMGNYWRVAHEFLLTAVRGKPKFRRRDIRSWAERPRTTHSAKPAEFRELVQSVSPGPYLELFGRVAAPDWTVWGNQVSSTLYAGGN